MPNFWRSKENRMEEGADLGRWRAGHLLGETSKAEKKTNQQILPCGDQSTNNHMHFFQLAARIRLRCRRAVTIEDGKDVERKRKEHQPLSSIP